MDSKSRVIEEKQRKEGKAALPEESSDVSHSGSSFPCMDKLREELSCAICLEICFEPSTTPCGHSFCKKCLRSAADKCGKRCPKCRQLISNGRSCTVNTILWNTIQLLFPKEVEARKASGILNSYEAERQSPEEASRNIPVPRRIGTVVRRRETSTQVEEEEEETLGSSWRRRRRGVSSQEQRVRRGRQVPSQEEDAALAFRLQREEFMGALSGGAHHVQPRTRSSFSSAREALRAACEKRKTSPQSRGRCRIGF